MELDYDQLLDNAMEKMPKRDLSKDRFQIPEANIEIQGNKTLIKNFADISSTLRRDPNHLGKYLFKELATPGNVQGSTLILQRKLQKDQIQQKIENYAKVFVYCKICGEPDTKFAKEGRIVFIQCDACGGRSPYRNL